MRLDAPKAKKGGSEIKTLSSPEWGDKIKVNRELKADIKRANKTREQRKNKES